MEKAMAKGTIEMSAENKTRHLMMASQTRKEKIMTFKKAYEYAMEHSDRFRKHDAHVKEMAAKGEPSGCMFFTVEPGETFYYGFDGCEMQKGKHTRRTSDRLIKSGNVLIIL